jgi:hypothetical protein
MLVWQIRCGFAGADSHACGGEPDVARTPLGASGDNQPTVDGLGSLHHLPKVTCSACGIVAGAAGPRPSTRHARELSNRNVPGNDCGQDADRIQGQ